MICTSCKTQMVVLELNQIEIDYCTSCQSIWLDSGEIELLLNKSPNKDLVFSTPDSQTVMNERKLKCPLCSKKMEKVKIGIADEVTIDRCKFGDGYWFDKNELQKVLNSNLDVHSPVVKQIQEMFTYKLR